MDESAPKSPKKKVIRKKAGAGKPAPPSGKKPMKKAPPSEVARIRAEAMAKAKKGEKKPPPPPDEKKEKKKKKKDAAAEAGAGKKEKKEKKKKERLPVHLRVTGMSLPMKATLVTSIGLAFLLIIFGIMIYIQVGKGLEEIVNKFGINTAKVLASTDPICWRQGHGTHIAIRNDIHQYLDEYSEGFTGYLKNELIHLARGENVNIEVLDGGAMDEEVFQESVTDEGQGEGQSLEDIPEEEQENRSKALYDRLVAGAKKRMAHNLYRIRNLVFYVFKDQTDKIFHENGPGIFDSSDIKDAWVNLKGAGGSLIKALPAKEKAIRFTPVSVEPFTFVKDGAVYESPAMIKKGSFSVGQDQRQIPGRIYTYPLFSVENPREEIGTATVLITDRKIESMKLVLMYTIAVSSIIIIAVGVVVSFFINKKLMSPVMDLTHDIEKVAQGDLSHRTKVTTHDEIGVLARSFDKMTRNLHEAREAEMEHKAREHEVKVVSEIKDNLLPKEIPTIQGFELSAYHNPSKEMGADYYDFIPVKDRYLGIITGSVAGQGIPAFIIMSMARSLIRAETAWETSPAKILCKVNSILAQDIRKGMYVSVLFAMLDKKEKSLTVASAGHGPMVIYRAEGEKLSLIHPDGLSLGLDKGAVFNERLKEEKVPLSAGDRILLHTQGVLKLANESDSELGDKRFYMGVKKEAPRKSDEFLKVLSQAVNNFMGKAPQKQDVTLVTLKRLA